MYMMRLSSFLPNKVAASILFCIMIIAVFATGQIHAQSTPTFADDIAPILYAKCTNCHRQGGIAPFAIESYTDARNSGWVIKESVRTGHMPPWSPDTTYTHFKGERTLNRTQIDAIVTWVNSGMPRGNIANEPSPPVYSSSSQLTLPVDATFRIPTYTVSTGLDEYRCFVIPSGTNQLRYLRQLEMEAGNPAIVHHMLLFADTTGQCRTFDAASPGPGYTNAGGIGVANAQLLGGWAPGTGPLELPGNFGIPILPNADLVLQVHYAPGSIGQADSSLFRFVYHPLSATGIRPVFQAPILNHQSTMLNGPLQLAAGEVKTFRQSFTTPFPATILTIFPHAHLICRDWKVYAYRPSSADTIPMIRINEWHFHWQGTYMYRKPIVLRPFDQLQAIGRYDNSVLNPFNPSDPPRPVTAGEGTLDEMMLVYLAFTPYQPGDENIILDSTLITSNPTKGKKDASNALAIINDQSTNTIRLANPDSYSTYSILSIDGKLVVQLPANSTTSQDLPIGIYTITARTNAGEFHRTRYSNLKVN
jgi:mono/diheme cytochrome c family protein